MFLPTSPCMKDLKRSLFAAMVSRSLPSCSGVDSNNLPCPEPRVFAGVLGELRCAQVRQHFVYRQHPRIEVRQQNSQEFVPWIFVKPPSISRINVCSAAGLKESCASYPVNTSRAPHRMVGYQVLSRTIASSRAARGGSGSP